MVAFRPSDTSFLSQLPTLPLLRAEEEVDLARQIEAGVYAKYLLDTNPLNRTESDLREITVAGDAAMERMIRSNLGLVTFVAKTYLGQGLDFEELVHEGIVGLVLAVQKFDYTRGLKFSSHAVWWIRYALTVGTANTGRIIRVPRQVHADINKLRRVERKLLGAGAPVSDCDVAESTGFSEKRVRQLRELAKPIYSLDASLRDDRDFSLAHLCAGLHDLSPLDFVLATELSGELTDVFSSLNEIEMSYLDLRYGISSGQPRSKAWLRKHLGLTPHQATAINDKIDGLMRHARAADERAEAKR